MTDTTRELIRSTASHATRARAPAKKPWQGWLDAELGFRNHWYPAALSSHIAEGAARGVTLLGEEILLTRQDGRLFAVEDRCCHRGVRFSARPLFYTRDTVTCWYHTWTYDLETGRLFTILTEPQAPIIGKCGLKPYPVTEAQGAVFIFVGDIEPPELSSDVPPGFLDDNIAVAAVEPYDIKANWRLACENGYDPGHHFIHNWSKLCIDADAPVPFGWVTSREDIAKTTHYETREPGPKGFTRTIAHTEMPFEATIPAKGNRAEVTVRPPLAEGKSPDVLAAAQADAEHGKVGLWLPCGLKVEDWPFKDVWHVEFYVPKDAGTHTYFQFGCKRVADETARRRWLESEHAELWKAIPDDFTGEDAFARENMEKFYAEEDGWHRERLFRPDIELTMWRRFASEHARGIQTRDHAKGVARP
ncbi:MAG: Rieske 2Fe-2S domain-containing protein [Alphaproteobacteria bacterium]